MRRHRSAGRRCGGNGLRCAVALLASAGLLGCSKEARDIGPAVPQTAPAGANDPRIASYQSNVFEIAQGGRYVSWYGCQACHSEQAPGVRNLVDGRWRHGGGFAQLYASIADRHAGLAYGAKVPPAQLWQMTAYLADLPQHTPEKRRRLTVDQQAEPVGSKWDGPQ